MERLVQRLVAGVGNLDRRFAAVFLVSLNEPRRIRVREKAERERWRVGMTPREIASPRSATLLNLFRKYDNFLSISTPAILRLLSHHVSLLHFFHFRYICCFLGIFRDLFPLSFISKRSPGRCECVYSVCITLSFFFFQIEIAICILLAFNLPIYLVKLKICLIENAPE